jgi:hypothetical protein
MTDRKAVLKNADMSEDEITKLALTHLPAEYKGIPDRAAVLAVTVISAELAGDEFTNSNDPKELARLRQILQNGYLREEWENEDKYVEQTALTQKSKQILESAKLCADSTTDLQAADADCVKKQFPDPNDFSKTVDVYMPATINKQIDEEAIKRGESVQPIVDWWRKYYGERYLEKQKKKLDLAARISPFKTDVKEMAYKLNKERSDMETGGESAQAQLQKSLEAALGKDGARIARSAAK